MDTSSEEEEDEFFETLEDISSASTSDNDKEADQSLQKVQLNQSGKPPVGALHDLNSGSKYEAWRNDTRSIQERRQELFQLMLLQDQRPYRKVETGSSAAMSASGTQKEESNEGSSSRSTLSLASLKVPSLGFGRSISVEEASSTRESSSSIERSRSDGRSLLQGFANPSDKPVTERVLDNSGAVLRRSPGMSLQGDQQRHRHDKELQEPKERSCNTNCEQEQAKTDDPVPLPSGSSTSEGKVSASPTREIWTQPSSSSERSLVDLFPAGEDHADDPSSSRDGSRGLVCLVKDLDTGKEFVVHELGTDGLWNKLREVGTDKEFTFEEFEESLGLSPIAKEVRKRTRATGVQLENGEITDIKEKKHKKKGWLRGIKNVARYVKGPMEKHTGYSSEGLQKSGSKHLKSPDAAETMPSWRPQKVKVRLHRKESREFSEMYMVQEFKGHQGPIWALKFNLDGCQLATGGQDCVVRVWAIKDHQSIGDEGSMGLNQKTFDTRVAEGNELPQVSKSYWIWSDERRSRRAMGRNNSVKTTIQPSKIFSIVEKAIRSFCGHTEDILDLAWSRSQFLLSSSMDKTVRLWHVLHEECLRIFSHHDYVTCIAVNPVDDRYFISGSLDGKVRIWSILDHHVVDWTDVREMVTAACYTPNGQGAVVGTFRGTCQTYKTSGNKLQSEASINVINVKKGKSRGKKITGIQFMHGGTKKMLITSNDSRIRVFDGVELDGKLKGFRNVSSQMSASFSVDDHYVVSASEDSRVYIWNVLNDSSNLQKGQKRKTNQACESFCSQNVSVALPWPGSTPFSNLAADQKFNKDCESENTSATNLEETTNDSTAVEIDTSSITFISKHDLEHDIAIGSGSHSRMTSKHSSFASTYFDCLPVGVPGDAIERSAADLSSVNGYPFWASKIFNDPSKRRSLRKSHSHTFSGDSLGLDVFSATDSSVVCSPISHSLEKHFSHIQVCMSKESCHAVGDPAVRVSAALSRVGPIQHSNELSKELDAFDIPIKADSLIAENLNKTQTTIVSPGSEMVIVTASLDGDIRIFQNTRSVAA